MNVEEKLRRAVEEHGQATTALDAAKGRHAVALERVEATKVELAEAHARLADDPHASKKARDVRAGHDDAIAVADILLESVSRGLLAVEVAAVAVVSARAELEAAAEAEQIAAAGKLLAEAAELDARATALRGQVEGVVSALVAKVPFGEQTSASDRVWNEVRAAAGMPRRDFLGNEIDASGRRIAA